MFTKLQSFRIAPKKTSLIWLLLNFSVALQAQFFGLAFDSIHPYVTALPYPKDGNYRVVSFKPPLTAGMPGNTSIKVYNSSRQFVKTISLLRGITLVNDYPPLLHGSRLLWPANFSDTLRSDQNSLVVLELDTTYSFIGLHTIATHSAPVNPTGLVRYSGGFVVGEYFSGVSPTRTGISTRLYKLGFDFTKRDSAWLEDELRLKTHHSQNNLIVGASDDLTSACASTVNTTQKITLDTNLIIVDCLNLLANSIHFCYDGGGNMVLRFADIYKRKGIVFPISNYKNYIHAEVDFYNCTNSNVKYNVVKNAVFVGNTSPMSYINNNYPGNTQYPLYFSSNTDYDNGFTINVTTIGLPSNYTVDKNFYAPYYATSNTWIMVTKIDTSGNMVWKRVYGGEMNYFPRSVAFTADGGCVVAGSRYNSATMYSNGVFENFLLKLDETGDITGIDEITSISKNICYPNPASQFVHFKLPYLAGSYLKIFDCLGQLVIEEQNYKSGEALSIQKLTPGVYTFAAAEAGGRICGKLIVQ